MPPEPKVSIVIPVYNGANFMREAIDSALAQTYRNREVIVVNDGSRDNGATDAIARGYGDNIKYFLKENGGVSSALNHGIRAMTGEHFSWLSHDDVYPPGKVEAQIEYLRRRAPLTCVYGDYDVIDEHSALVRHNPVRHVEPAALPFELILSFPVNGCTTLIPRRCFDAVGLFDERLRYTQDNEMWYRLAENFPFEHMRAVLLLSRAHAQAGTYLDSPAFIAEGNEITITLLKRLMTDRLAAAEPDDAARFLLDATVRLKGSKGFFKAARFAWDLFLAKRAGARAGSRLRMIPEELHCRLLDLASYRWFLLKSSRGARRVSRYAAAARGILAGGAGRSRGA
jgi:hypothetical protein